MRNSFGIWRLGIVVMGIMGICFFKSIFVKAASFPELSVDYSGIINVMEERRSPENINKRLKDNGMEIKASYNELFMKEENAINIHIRMDRSEADKGELEEGELKGTDIVNDFCPEDIKIELYRIEYDTEEEIEIKRLVERRELERKDIDENGVCQEFFCSIKNLEEGHYKVIIKYEGQGEESLFVSEKSDKETDNCMKDGYYESPTCTVDTKKPIITEVFYDQNITRRVGKRRYFQKIPKIIIRIQEENFNREDFCLEGRMFYANGTSMKEEWRKLERQIQELQWESYYKEGTRINEVSIRAEQEANYTLGLRSKDGAGQISDLKEAQFTYDCTKPELAYTGTDNITEDLIFKVLDNGVNNNFFKFHNYNFFRYFGSGKMCVSVRVRDAISGVEKIKYSFVASDRYKREEDLSALGMVSLGKEVDRGTSVVKNTDLSEIIIYISPEQKNFKGYLRVCGQDYGGNSGEVIESKGAISESAQLHDKVSNISIKLPEPFFVDKEKNINYYDKSVPIYASFEDRQSGLYKTSLYADKSVGNAVMWDGESIVYQKEQRMVLSAEDFDKHGNGPMEIEAQMEDNAGHIDKKILDKKIVIDKVKPEIKVTYDHNNDTSYYNTSRKAIVTIKEKNFNSKLVKWNIHGSNTKYRIGEWNQVKGVNQCEVCFEEDGQNYAVQLSVTDYAGNKAEWRDNTYFTIDKVAPEVSVNLEQADWIVKSKDRIKASDRSDSEIKYFNSEQTVKFCIKDKNFDRDKMEYNIEAVDGKRKVNIEGPTKYVKKGDEYYGRITLKEEAKYHIAVKCMDKAGNESEVAELEEFVIDTTSPKVTVEGIENNKIYEGSSITPKVLCQDKSLDMDAVKMHLCKINGQEVTKKEWDYEQQINTTADTVQWQWNNLDNVREKDGIYQLFIEAADKAGNRLRDNNKFVFRINRWGAEFILDTDVKQELNKHYLREAPEIILKEQCVKKTKSKVVILRDNEDRSTINQENVKQYIITDKASHKYGWHEKLYNLGQDYFEKEGDYQISFQADSKAKKIRFVVDRTPPSVSIGNLEKEIYEGMEHEFTVSIMDNYAFKKLELYIEESGGVGKPKNVQKKVIKPEDLNENYTIRETLLKSGKKQTIRYVAWDKAGNKTDSDICGDTRRCYVTENKALKGYYKNSSHFKKNNTKTNQRENTRLIKIAGRSIVVLTVLCAGGYLSVKMKKTIRLKRELEEKENTGN